MAWERLTLQVGCLCGLRWCFST